MRYAFYFRSEIFGESSDQSPVQHCRLDRGTKPTARGAGRASTLNNSRALHITHQSRYTYRKFTKTAHGRSWMLLLGGGPPLICVFAFQLHVPTFFHVFRRSPPVAVAARLAASKACSLSVTDFLYMLSC